VGKASRSCLAAHQAKIRPFFEFIARINLTSVESCLKHLKASHLTHFIHLAACTKSLPHELRNVHEKVADKIRSDGVKDVSVNTLAKAAQYSHELQSVFESKRINPVVKKHFDPAFKKKLQEEYNLCALHGRDDARGVDVCGGRRARGGAGRERGCGPSNKRGRGRDKSVDRAMSQDRGEVVCFVRDSSERGAGALKCPKLAKKSRATIQKRVEFLDVNKGAQKMREQLRELKQLRNEKKAHFRMLSANINADDMEAGCGFDHEDDFEDENKEDGFAVGAVKSLKCFCVKCATTCACNAIRSLSPASPVLSVSNPIRTAVLTCPFCAPTKLFFHNVHLSLRHLP